MKTYRLKNTTKMTQNTNNNNLNNNNLNNNNLNNNNLNNNNLNNIDKMQLIDLKFNNFVENRWNCLHVTPLYETYYYFNDGIEITEQLKNCSTLDKQVKLLTELKHEIIYNLIDIFYEGDHEMESEYMTVQVDTIMFINELIDLCGYMPNLEDISTSHEISLNTIKSIIGLCHIDSLYYETQLIKCITLDLYNLKCNQSIDIFKNNVFTNLKTNILINGNNIVNMGDIELISNLFDELLVLENKLNIVFEEYKQIKYVEEYKQLIAHYYEGIENIEIDSNMPIEKIILNEIEFLNDLFQENMRENYFDFALNVNKDINNLINLLKTIELNK